MTNKMKTPLTALLAFVLSTASFHTLEARYAGFGTDSYLKAKGLPRSKSGAHGRHADVPHDLGLDRLFAERDGGHAHGGHAAVGPLHQEDEHLIVPYGRSSRDSFHRHHAIPPLSSTRPAPHHQGSADEDERVFSRSDFRHAAGFFYDYHQAAMATQAQQHRAELAAQAQHHRAELAAQAQRHQAAFDSVNERLRSMERSTRSLVSSGGHAGSGHDAHADGDHAHGGHG